MTKNAISNKDKPTKIPKRTLIIIAIKEKLKAIKKIIIFVIRYAPTFFKLTTFLNGTTPLP